MNLARHMTPDQPFYGISAASSGRVVESVLHIEDMATHYIEEIRTLQPERPYFLGGYSFGGSVALEIAQQLDAQGQQVATWRSWITHLHQDVITRLSGDRLSLFSFLRNIPYWIIDDIFNSEFDEILNRIRLNVRNVKRRIDNFLGHTNRESIITEIID